MDLRSEDTQNELDFKWKYDFIYWFLIKKIKPPKNSWKYVFDTWFECWKMHSEMFIYTQRSMMRNFAVFAMAIFVVFCKLMTDLEVLRWISVENCEVWGGVFWKWNVWKIKLKTCIWGKLHLEMPLTRPKVWIFLPCYISVSQRKISSLVLTFVLAQTLRV